MSVDKVLLIEQSWLSYRAAVLPGDAAATQVIETRRAFYAGARGLLTIIMSILEPGSEVTEGDLRTMVLIEAELRLFAAQVRAGLA
jgi:hypothetical protein